MKNGGEKPALNKRSHASHKQPSLRKDDADIEIIPLSPQIIPETPSRIKRSPAKPTTHTPNKSPRCNIKLFSPQKKEECPICFDKITEKTSISSCTHVFCFTCISQWAKSSSQCPLCRKDFNSLSKVGQDVVKVKKRKFHHELPPEYYGLDFYTDGEEEDEDEEDLGDGDEYIEDDFVVNNDIIEYRNEPTQFEEELSDDFFYADEERESSQEASQSSSSNIHTFRVTRQRTRRANTRRLPSRSPRRTSISRNTINLLTPTNQIDLTNASPIPTSPASIFKRPTNNNTPSRNHSGPSPKRRKYDNTRTSIVVTSSSSSIIPIDDEEEELPIIRKSKRLSDKSKQKTSDKNNIVSSSAEEYCSNISPTDSACTSDEKRVEKSHFQYTASAFANQYFSESDGDVYNFTYVSSDDSLL